MLLDSNQCHRHPFGALDYDLARKPNALDEPSPAQTLPPDHPLRDEDGLPGVVLPLTALPASQRAVLVVFAPFLIPGFAGLVVPAHIDPLASYP